MQPPLNTRVDVPVEACRFVADFKPGTPGEGNTVPFTCLARTANPVPHWYWGERCVHDFSGMEAAASCIVDYEHYQDVLGVANKIEVLPDGLQLSGLLTPFLKDDRASEVAHKAQLGVPYQGSIDFDPYYIVIEDVPSGFSAAVNGAEYSGPLTIFRKWKLRGLAICKQGVDGGTSVKFSKEQLSGQTVSVTRFSKGIPMDPATTPAPAAATPPATPAATPPGTAAPIVVATEVPATAVVVAPAGATQLSRKEEGKLFADTFGPVHGPTLFAAGHSMGEAHTEFAKILRTENEALKSQLAKGAQPAAGGAVPVSFSSAEGQPAASNKWSNLPDSVAKVAKGIKIPGRS